VTTVSCGGASSSPSQQLTAVGRVLRRACWYACAAYALGSPPLTLLPSGSTSRGAILTLVPLIGATALHAGLPIPRLHIGKEAVLPAFVLILLGWQTISAVSNLGLGYVAHAAPAASLIALAFRARGPLMRFDADELRHVARFCVTPLLSLLLLGFVLQLVGVIPSLYPSQFPLAVHGSRFQGLSVHPDSTGVVAGVAALTAFIAHGDRWVYFGRAAAIAALLATNSRTALIATVAAVYVYWMIGPGRTATARVKAIASGAVLAPLLEAIILVRRSTAHGDLLSGRQIIWANARDLASLAPTLGFGPETIALASRLLEELDPRSPKRKISGTRTRSTSGALVSCC